MDPRGVPYGDDDRTVPRGPGLPWQPPPAPAAPPSQNKWMWIVIAATVVIVVVSVVIVTVSSTGGESTTAAPTSTTSSPPEPSMTTRTSTPAPAPPPPTQAPPAPAPGTPVAPDALMDLLLTPPEVAAVYQVPSAAERASGNDPLTGTSKIPLLCRSAWFPAYKEAYLAGYTGVARKTIGEEPSSGQSKGVIEAVLAYPDAAAATAARDQIVALWRDCQNIRFTETLGANERDWMTGIVGNNGGVDTLLIWSQSFQGQPPTDTSPNCQRGLTVARNVVVDVLACGPGSTFHGLDAAREIAQKITAAP